MSRKIKEQFANILSLSDEKATQGQTLNKDKSNKDLLIKKKI